VIREEEEALLERDRLRCKEGDRFRGGGDVESRFGVLSRFEASRGENPSVCGGDGGGGGGVASHAAVRVAEGLNETAS